MALGRSLPQEPVRFTADAGSVVQAGDALLNTARDAMGKLVSEVTPETASFQNVMRVLLELENESQLTSNVIAMYALVAPDANIRNAAANVTDEIAQFWIENKADTDILRLVEAVYQRHLQPHEVQESERLDPESRKALSEERRKRQRSVMVSGSDLSHEGEDESRLSRMQRRLKSVEAELMRNLDERQHCLWLTHEDLTGVPDDILASMERGTGEHSGHFQLDLTGMQARLLPSVVTSSATRRSIYLAARRIAADNIPLFNEVIQLRHQSALLRGYPSHLAYRVEDTMAKTPNAVLGLIEGLRDRVLERLSDDVEKLLQMKKEESVLDPPPPDADVIHWSDLQYYIRLYEERHYSINQHQIAAYFPIYQTVERMLTLFGRLFGFVFINETGAGASTTDTLAEDLTWHEDVVLYSVWDDSREGGGFVGYLYLDLHPRPGKSGGAQCRPLQLGFERPDVKRHYPSTVLLANFPRPTAAPSLLQHSDVVLLFHELGHAMHDLAGRCRYSRFHGAETVGDFTEAPSQMLENWCWDAASLRLLSGHHATGEPMPDSMIASLIRTRVVLPAAKLLPQLRMTLFDLAVHSSVTVVPSEGSDAIINVQEIYARHSELGNNIKSAGDEYGYASYRHLFSGSDALMYGYIWSKVLAMDMFETLFRHNPLDDAVGRRYRRLLLEKGGSVDEMQLVTQVLGRSPSSEAFYRSLGLYDGERQFGQEDASSVHSPLCV
ncbi:hypothetical protein F5Y17DRAFT_168526 [Xylariaceae sp. FL0594]|nr:hypothetical protein F5Y17DRAFT_168526 [Xylariaceae sp. FL0594]